MQQARSHNIVIMHGTFSSPEINWFPWLKQELEADGHKVATPTFPTPENQHIDSWIGVLDDVVSSYDENLILVGHSSACLVICARLQQLQHSIKAAFLVAPFLGVIGIEEYDEANAGFNDYPYEWEQIRSKSRFCAYRADNDPYVPIGAATRIPLLLGVKETVIPGGGHLNSEAGYDEFPGLLEDIRKVITA